MVDLMRSRKGKHHDYIADRIHELHREITELAIHEASIPIATIKRKRALMFKYRRYLKLLKK